MGIKESAYLASSFFAHLCTAAIVTGITGTQTSKTAAEGKFTGHSTACYRNIHSARPLPADSLKKGYGICFPQYHSLIDFMT